MAVVTQIVTCEVCDTKTLVKFQVGILNQYPIHYSCPTCLTHIYGDIIHHEEEGRIEYKLNNASHSSKGNEEYILVVSGEFPSSKIVKSNEETFKAAMFSPFIRYSPHENREVYKYEVLVQTLPNLIEYEWKMIERIANLYFNNQDRFLEGEVDKLRESPRLILSSFEKDSSVSKLITTVFRELSSTNPLIPITIENVAIQLKTLSQDNNQAYVELLQLYSLDDLLKIQQELFSLFNAFIAHYRYLVPVIYMEAIERRIEDIKDYEGLNTVSFERLDRLYQNAYETLLENSTLTLMLDNLLIRSSVHSMNTRISVRRQEVVNLHDYKGLTKGQKLGYLLDNANILSHIFSIPLDKDLRNPIGHNNYSYDPNSQLIQFHSNNPNRAPKELFLIEFADKCFQSIKINLLLWDITVLMRKLIKEEQ
ncbi:hypothetical protein [Paenibacillus sp. FSL R10-2748]|uniref:hypothetical protein n=1 Tax=Paenibacillus sp. FSL R10-2748 TaxID=2954658 RepID=UPI0030FAFEFC